MHPRTPERWDRTNPVWYVEYVRNPNRADGELILRREPNRISILTKLQLRGVVDLHDRIASIISKRELIVESVYVP